MSDHITLSGIVGTEPRHFTTSSGVEIVSFRMATSQSYFDQSANEWKDPGSNWFTVSAFRQLANNCSTSIEKGQRVLVVGRLKLRQWEQGDKAGLNVEVEAVSIGHDLAYGTAQFTRVNTAHDFVNTDDSMSGQSEGWPTAAPADSPAGSPADSGADSKAA